MLLHIESSERYIPHISIPTEKAAANDAKKPGLHPTLGNGRIQSRKAARLHATDFGKILRLQTPLNPLGTLKHPHPTHTPPHSTSKPHPLPCQHPSEEQRKRPGGTPPRGTRHASLPARTSKKARNPTQTRQPKPTLAAGNTKNTKNRHTTPEESPLHEREPWAQGGSPSAEPNPNTSKIQPKQRTPQTETMLSSAPPAGTSTHRPCSPFNSFFTSELLNTEGQMSSTLPTIRSTRDSNTYPTHPTHSDKAPRSLLPHPAHRPAQPAQNPQ
ncbi:uncharacterized protein LOC133191654 [Saccostrea echinata]|uniref:uncharacterized protein LOC133191654 n=1 Tax=Saccostrea echinata TaxID=191078 RepID=UPI002A821E64|nr:uncharacterized protein LOC133191654 [Saccostrea echinata]